MKGSEQRNIFAAAQLVLEGEDKAQKSVVVKSPGHRLHGKTARVFHDFGDGRLNVQIRNSDKKGDFTNLTLKKGEYSLSESTEDDSSLSEAKTYPNYPDVKKALELIFEMDADEYEALLYGLHDKMRNDAFETLNKDQFDVSLLLDKAYKRWTNRKGN